MVPARRLTSIHGVGNIPARDGAPAPRVFLSGGPLKDVILTPEGYEKLKQEIEYPLERQASRGSRPHPRRARVRRHRGERRVRRREERAGPARAPHRHARGAAAQRPRDHQEGRRQGRRLDRLEGQAPRHRREADGRVPHRRLRRGEPGREQALERVAGRQGDHRQEEGRDGRGRGPARGDEVQDPRDQSRLDSAARCCRSGSQTG